MAIATVERDSTRGSGASEPRFKLVEEVCRTGDLQFWRATDRRSGKPCVVRVIDAGREESSRRLGDLHRERQLAERIAHAAVLCPSFYKTRIVSNPTGWDRLRQTVRQVVIGPLQRRRARALAQLAF